MDLILDYPTDKIAFIGLFMTDVKYQNRGISSGIIKELCSFLKQKGYKKVRLGVNKENPQSNSFWQKNGFFIVSVKEYNIMEFCL